MDGPIVYSRLKGSQYRGLMSLVGSQNWHFNLIDGRTQVFTTACPITWVDKSIRGATISLRVYRVVDLRELPETELQFHLVLHVHDEREGLYELRGFSGTTPG